MSEIRKRMIFKADGLSKSCKLLLTFKQLEGLGEDQLKDCWRAIDFGANSTRSAAIEYVNQLVVISPQSTQGNTIEPLTHMAVKVGGAVKIVRDSQNSVNIVSTNQGTKPDFIVARNETGRAQDIQVGVLSNPRKDPEPIFTFHRVLDSLAVEYKFEPTLYAYVTSESDQNPANTSEIQSPKLWEQDLTKLGPETRWRLTYDKDHGTYQLVSDD